MYQCSLLILTLQNPHVQPHRFSHNTRHLKFPAGEFPAARSDTSNSKSQARTRTHTHAPGGALVWSRVALGCQDGWISPVRGVHCSVDSSVHYKGVGTEGARHAQLGPTFAIFKCCSQLDGSVWKCSCPCWF